MLVHVFIRDNPCDPESCLLLSSLLLLSPIIFLPSPSIHYLLPQLLSIPIVMFLLSFLLLFFRVSIHFCLTLTFVHVRAFQYLAYPQIMEKCDETKMKASLREVK
jgi:hypothetical protein